MLLVQWEAFDTSDHDKLLDCVSSWFSVDGIFPDWIKSNLSDLSLCNNLGSILSDAKKLFYGLRHGSLLGIVLFSLYTNPLSKVIRNHPTISAHFYADDIKLYVHLKNNRGPRGNTLASHL